MKDDIIRSMKFSLIYKYRHGAWILLYLIVPIWFFLLQKLIIVWHPVECGLDARIPFIKVFLIPYVLWFPFLAGTIIFLFIKDKQDFYRLIKLLYPGVFVCMIIYTIYPTTITFRPDITNSTGFFSWGLKFIFYVDDPKNIWPSQHVYNALACALALTMSKNSRRPKWAAVSSWILTVFIMLSTVFIKQHSVLDVIAAIILFAIISAVVILSERFACKRNPSGTCTSDTKKG